MASRDLYATLIVAALVYLPQVARAGSCSAANLCCQGRDSGCVIQKESPNAIIGTPRDKPCYCDHACLKLADCCDDFRDTCGVVDCVVGEWGSWTSCSNGCGSGTQKRNRTVKIADKNGGKHCPRLDQSRTCRSFASCQPGLRPTYHDKSVTFITLESSGDNSTDNYDIVENNISGRSCLAFTILRTSRSCGKIATTLAEGLRICVENEDGKEENEILAGVGRWRIVDEPSTSCHGKWIGDPSARIDCNDARCTLVPSRVAIRTRRDVREVATLRRRRGRRRSRRQATSNSLR